MTLEEWQESVKNEYESLNKCYLYLNEEGRQRLAAFSVLYNLSLYLGGARELYEYIQNENYLKLTNSATLAILTLGEIVAKEGKYVDYSSP